MWDSRQKILSSKALAFRSAELRAAGRRIVLTNGCFDVLHAGHVRYLAQARSLGDALVVAINGDASARRLKGPGRPLNGVDDRAEVISALAAVDYVVVFDDDTAVEIVQEIRPAIYVKGGDYSAEQSDDNFPPEGHAALHCGAEVRILNYLPGRSTSATIGRIKDHDASNDDGTMSNDNS